MIMNTPSKEETLLIVEYYWERLTGNEHVGLNAEGQVSLSKTPRYFARRELLKVKTSQDLVKWANRWVDADSWRKAKDNVRSFRYKAKHGLSRINISQPAKAVLSERATIHGMPIWQYIACLNLKVETLIRLEKEEGMLATNPLDGNH